MICYSAMQRPNKATCSYEHIISFLKEYNMRLRNSIYKMDAVTTQHFRTWVRFHLCTHLITSWDDRGRFNKTYKRLSSLSFHSTDIRDRTACICSQSGTFTANGKPLSQAVFCKP